MKNFDCIDNVFDDYISEVISDNDLINIVNSENKKQYINFNDLIADYIRFSCEIKNSRYLENAITMINPNELNQELLELCHLLLLEDWHPWQEDIVYVLEKNNSLSSLAFLYKAFEIKYQKHKFNAYYSLHKKIMWTIYKIEGAKCKPKLLKMEKFISKDLTKEFKQFLGNIK
ncbi:hypothetical protein [Capnocytophaga sp.]|uniref:hypothetical protein n=1 Tax=Capnocytophaga sp. TaxID=44737 RepID=UPI0026DAC35D|nr:hypothetical protein [Capnocytophaga sp.]MDO5106083.1 hypothetical protein [Capnocytophaga sp.]